MNKISIDTISQKQEELANLRADILMHGTLADVGSDQRFKEMKDEIAAMWTEYKAQQRVFDAAPEMLELLEVLSNSALSYDDIIPAREKAIELIKTIKG